MKWTLISQGGAGDQTLGKALAASIGAGQFDRLDVAVAYATLPGVKALVDGKRVHGEKRAELRESS